ncbi:MAG: hypothetical protein NZ528_06140 [Caldilineales bacterium]|nr:hypothetical protein [Caldilineales bacterium]MDW8317395.1 hypothetical protein [Anaerolineae bacterium]
MPSIPPAALRRLYVKGSLSNTDHGVELALVNHLAPCTLIGVGPLEVDGAEYGSERLTARFERRSLKPGRQPEPLVRAAASIDLSRAVRFDLETTLRVQMDGLWLAPGEHRCLLHLATREVGVLSVEITDQVTDRRSR